MKQIILFILLGLNFQILHCQTYAKPYVAPTKVNVTVTKNPYDFGAAWNQGMQAGAAARAARAADNAAQTEAMKDTYSNISVDNLINNTDKYEYIVLENIGGWKKGVNKNSIIKILKEAKKYQIIKNNQLPSVLINNPKVLYLNWLREAQGDYHRITQLSIKNSDGLIIYESTSKNLSHQEILKPLISNYLFTKEMALAKIEELKKFLDLGVISKEEYDLKVVELKPIIIGNN